jgi:pimeloyl-ACP methyl ester carboxylesterase
MNEEPFEVSIPGGRLRGHRGGSGPPALLLHGGAAVPDYLDSLAAELGGLFSTYRYTQRGTPPSSGGPPFTVETHMADALAVLDKFGVDRGWAVGHSWGGHLALHLLVSHPERLLGVVAIDTLGAFASVFPEQDPNLRRGLSPGQVARLDEIEAKRRADDVSEAELVERFALIWPQFFFDPSRAIPPPARAGAEASIGVNRSLGEHFERGTLAERLPAAELPVLFLHGAQSAMPVGSTIETGALVPEAEVVVVPDCGHFPWIEQPGSVRSAVKSFLAR